jgi:uncharacterized protein (DUF342 family)
MSNWLLTLLGMDPEVKRRRTELKQNLDAADAKLDELQKQLEEVGRCSDTDRDALSRTLIGLDDAHRTAQRT